MVTPYLAACSVQTIPSCCNIHRHGVEDAGALPGPGLTELGPEPCDTLMHMG